jgi:WD40 repeat protein
MKTSYQPLPLITAFCMRLRAIFVATLLAITASADERPAPTRLLVSDHRPNRLAIINTTDGRLEWEYPCKHPQDCHWLPDGTILAAVGDEAQIIKPDLAAGKGGDVIWSVKPGGEVPVAQPLPDGGIMVACSPGPKGLIIEFDKERKEVRRMEVTTQTRGHSQYRFCRKTPQGTYLIPSVGDGILYELDGAGKALWTLPLARVCAAERLADGSTLVAGAGTIRCYDKDRKEQWVLSGEDMNLNPGTLAGMYLLPEGGFVVANWGRKGEQPKNASAIAIGADRRVLWRLNHPMIGSAGYVQPLDPVPLGARSSMADGNASKAVGANPIPDARIKFESWHCVGPFKDELFGLFSRSYNTPFGPESNLVALASLPGDLKAVYRTADLPGEEDTARYWKEQKEWKDGYWCEMPQGPTPGRNEVVYAYRTITADKDTTIRARILAQDAVKVWLNGVEIFRVYDKPRTFMRRLNEGRFDIPLKAGDNRLLIKIAAYHGRRGFALVMPAFTPEPADFRRLALGTSSENRFKPGYEPYASSVRNSTHAAPEKPGAKTVAASIEQLNNFHFDVKPFPAYDPPRLKMVEILDQQHSSTPQGEQYIRKLARLREQTEKALSNLNNGHAGAEKDVTAAAEAHDQFWNEEIRSLGPIVFIRRPLADINTVSPYNVKPVSPSEICVFDPARRDEPPKVIYRDDKGSVYDLNISYDATRLFFSATREGVKGGWHIYEIGVDGKNLKQITSGDCNDISPLLLPSGEMIFVSDRAKNRLVCQKPLAGVLYTCNRDGQNVRKVSGNTLSDHTPQMLNDGRVLFTRWDYGVNVNVFTRQALWSMNPDGTQLQLFFGNSIEDPAGFYQARSIPGRQEIICTFGPHHKNHAGSLGMVWNGNGLEAPRGEGLRWVSRELPITDDMPFPHGYQHPWPVNERQFLVSYGGDGEKRNRIYLVDDRGNKRCVYQDDKLGCWWPIQLVPRTVPPVIPTRSNNPEYTYRAPMDVNSSPADTWATLLAFNIYDGLPKYIKSGEIKHLQIMEQVPKTHAKGAPEAWGDSPIIGRGTYYVRRLLGVVPVEPDGSAHFLVPAIRDISINALDSDGRVVQMMKTTTQVMPGEITSCTGCHEHDRKAPMHGTKAKAAGLPPFKPAPPSDWGTDGIIDYAKVVQPVFDKHCVKCHSGAQPKGGVDFSGDVTRYFNMSYNTLCDRGLVFYGNLAGEPPMKSTPMAFGSQVSRIRKYIETDHSGKILPLEDRQRIYTWIDADIPFYGTYAHTSQNLKLTGYRDRWHVGTETDWFNKEFMPTFEKRCVDCHQRTVDCTQPYATTSIMAKVTSTVWPNWTYMSYFFGSRDPIAAYAGPDYRVNLTHPEWSQMLTAPLAKDGGGLGLCKDKDGQPVYKDKKDPDYEVMLKALQYGCEILKANPIDMPPPNYMRGEEE